MAQTIPLMRPYFDEDEIREVKKVLDSGWVAQGPECKEFEKQVCGYLGIANAVTVTNCTAALHLALLSIGIKPKDEVLVADHTYPATGHSVVYCGAKPRFVDVDPRTYNIDPSKIEKKISKKTKALIVVHTFGQPARMDEVMEIARKHGIKVIEDAACAFGAKYDGKMAGCIGDVGCYSLHARKGITTGEGGLVVSREQAVTDKVRKLSVFGITTAYDRQNMGGFVVPIFDELGYNYKMSDITAAIGVAQLKKIDVIIKRKRELAKYWDNVLKGMDLISAPYVDEKAFHIYQTYVALVDKKVNRNSLIEKLKEKGVQTQIGTYSSYVQPVYRSKDKCPNSLDVFNRSIALPLFNSLKESEIDFCARILKETLEESK